MARYHMSAKHGKPTICRALKNCPLGGEGGVVHGDSPEETMAAYEKQQSSNTVPKSSPRSAKATPPPGRDSATMASDALSKLDSIQDVQGSIEVGKSLMMEAGDIRQAKQIHQALFEENVNRNKLKNALDRDVTRSLRERDHATGVKSVEKAQKAVDDARKTLEDFNQSSVHLQEVMNYTSAYVSAREGMESEGFQGTIDGVVANAVTFGARHTPITSDATVVAQVDAVGPEARQMINKVALKKRVELANEVEALEGIKSGLSPYEDSFARYHYAQELAETHVRNLDTLRDYIHSLDDNK